MEKINIAGIDEEIYLTTSNKGLPIYIWKNPYAKSFYLSLNVKYGSLDTEFIVNGKKKTVPSGIAHFMEHIKFNIDKDKTANDLFDPLGSDINAFTTFKYTSYLVYGTKKISENLINLLTFVLNPYFTKEIIKKEKGIIISEVNMGEDQPYNKLYFEFNRAIYHKSKFRELITGEESDVKRTNLEDIKLVYDTFYHPKNMFLVVTGNVNPYEIEKITNETLNNLDIPEYLNPEIITPKEPKTVVKKEKTIYSNIEVEKAKIGLKIERKNFKNYDKISLSIILNLILASNFGDTSDLKEQLLEEGLITYMNFNRYVGDEYVIIDITIESKYIDAATTKVIDALNNLSMSEEDFKRKINSALASIIVTYEAVDEVNNLIQNYLINYQSIVPNLKEIYESITTQDCEDVISKINLKEMTIIKMLKEN